MPLPRPLAAGLAALSCLALASCSSGLAKTTGQLVAGGSNQPLAAGESARVDFATADGSYPPLMLTVYVKKDGSFVADMNDGSGRGLRPGKYKVRLDRESTTVKDVNPKLFKEDVPVDVQPSAATHLVVDLKAGTITPK